MNKKILFAIIALIGIIGVVVLTSLLTPKQNDFLARYDLESMSVQEMVSHLENKLDETADFRASITGSNLSLGDTTYQVELDLPNGQFYLSFAPYISQTHPCSNHNLVTCRGELKNVSFEVTVVDTESNSVILEDNMTSSSNGFTGIWLPKNKTYQITVTYGNLSASEEVSTFSTSNTCLTTLQLT
jgi:hypothetical protein